MIEAVFFEIGDTLIHLDTSHPRELVSAAVHAIHASLVERGHRTQPVDLYENVIWRRLVRAFFWSRLRRREVNLVWTVGAVHHQLGIVFNELFPAVAVDAVLRAEGLLDFFATRIYSSEVDYRHPHREIFRIALRSLGVRPAQTLYVGDNLRNDVRDTSRVEMITAWLTENEADQVYRARPDHVIRKLSELFPILQVDQRHAR